MIAFNSNEIQHSPQHSPIIHVNEKSSLIFTWVTPLHFNFLSFVIRYSVTAITSRFHRGDRGSTPRIGVFIIIFNLAVLA